MKGGYWVLWDGRIPAVWPKDGDVSGGERRIQRVQRHDEQLGDGRPDPDEVVLEMRVARVQSRGRSP